MRTLKITKNFDCDIRSPQGALRGQVSYTAGTVRQNVPEAHAEAILNAGAGEEVSKTETKSEDTKSAKRG